MTIIIGTPYTRGAGYLLNNKDLGVAKREEADIQTCSHCQAVLKMQEWKKKGAWCGKCMKPLCLACGKLTKTLGCSPFIRMIEQIAEREMRFQQFRKLAGLEPVAAQPIITGTKD